MLVRSKISQESNGRGDIPGDTGKKVPAEPQDMFAYLLLFYRFISSSDNEIVERYSPIVHGSHWLLHPVPGVQRLRLESRVVHVTKHCHLLLSPDDDDTRH